MISQISAEKFWPPEKPFPPQININSNLNILDVKANPESIETKFVFNINYAPSIAQINLRGKAIVTGLKNDVQNLLKEYKESGRPSPFIVQSISNTAFVEATLISRILGVPPPIPLPAIVGKGKSNQSPSYVA